MAIDVDRSSSLLERTRTPEGFNAEFVRGEIVMSPRGPRHFETIVGVLEQLIPQFPPSLSFTGGSMTPFPDDDSILCPDVAVVPAAESDKDLAVFPAELIELAVEVVSPATARRDYDLKPGVYGRAGIPVYLIADLYRAQLTIYSLPGADGYRSKLLMAYGELATIPTVPPMTLDTSSLPAERP